jgi:hypothetical protein
LPEIPAEHPKDKPIFRTPRAEDRFYFQFIQMGLIEGCHIPPESLS